ncbi:hypothetical protein Cgig2_010215 [Carnegiea gigantea]|uniref:Uncharacterized protein n=1 Tax=Carnegiea gigantea TaxID=171969 RepID=A0A9Q1JUA4_9CARY|nr:hypothetical protein Cgig2_010215 [Carnegiea gigantea]
MDSSIVEGREDGIEEHAVVKKPLDIEANEGDEDMYTKCNMFQMCYLFISMEFIDGASYNYKEVGNSSCDTNELFFPGIPLYIGTSYSQNALTDYSVAPFNLPSTSLHIQLLGNQDASPSMSFHPAYYLDPSNGSSMFILIPPVFHQLHTGNFLPDAAHTDKH